jgi:iron complex outermembrane receptor protein
MNEPISVSVKPAAGQSYGAFVSLDLHVTDRLSLNGAIRYTYETKSIGRITQRYPNLNLDPSQLLLNLSSPGKANFEQFTPKFGINFQATNDILLYATYSNGFRSGGFNIRPAPVDSDAFDPETVDTFELGLKSTFLDRRVRLNLSAFQSDYKDIQLLAREGTSIFTINGGQGRIRGFEAELDATIVEGFKVNASVGYLDTELTKATTTAVDAGARTGNRLPYAPRWTFTGGAEYGFSVGDSSKLTFRVDASHRSSLFYNVNNTPFDYAKGNVLVNGRVTLRHDNLSLSAFATNLFNKRYFTLTGDNSKSPVTGYVYGAVNEPRRLGIQLGVDF